MTWASGDYALIGTTLQIVGEYVFRTWYGPPCTRAFAALPPDEATALERDLTDLLNSMNRAGAGSLVVPSEYLEIVVMRR